MAGKPTTYKELEQKIKEFEKESKKYRMIFEHAGVSITLTDTETGERVAIKIIPFSLFRSGQAETFEKW